MNRWVEFHECLRIAWAAIGANKMRSGLTTLGIIIGVVTVTLMGTAIEGLNRAFIKSISAIGSDVLYVERYSWFGNEEWWKVRNRREITLRDAHRVAKESSSALAVSAFTGMMHPVQYKNRSASGVMIMGATAETAITGNLTVQTGRFLTAEEVDGVRPVCVLGATLATNFFTRESPLGKKIKVHNHSYEVVGVLDKMGEFLGMMNLDNRLMMPISRFQTDLNPWEDVTIEVKIRDITQVEDATEEIRAVMRKIRRLDPGEDDDFAINRQDQFVKMFKKISGIIASVGLFITGLSLFVGGIGIMNIMFVSVAERTQEIGVRKAMGAKRRTIMLQFLTESAMICLLGGGLALVLAYPLTLLLGRVLPATMSLSVAGLALLVSLLTGVVSGMLPAYRAARMNPVEALRHE